MICVYSESVEIEKKTRSGAGNGICVYDKAKHLCRKGGSDSLVYIVWAGRTRKRERGFVIRVRRTKFIRRCSTYRGEIVDMRVSGKTYMEKIHEKEGSGNLRI